MSRRSVGDSMKRSTLLVAVLPLASLGALAQGPPCGSPPCEPQTVITGTELFDGSICVNPCDGILLISGRNLGDTAPFGGTVKLFIPPAEQVLTVVAFDPVAQNLAAELPVGTLGLPGTFLLTVSTGPSAAATDVFDATLAVADLLCVSCVSETELDFDPATQSELDTHAGFADSHREHATLEESAEIDADISAHAGNAWVHHRAVTLEDLTPTTTKGDLLVADGSSVVRLPVGTDGQVLVADSTQPTGLRWADVASSNRTYSKTPATGQTTSYGPRDDGELQRGVAWPNPRFSDNGDGTVTDNLTELIWLKNARCFWFDKTWHQALADANGLASGSCGLTDGSVAGDWRLPNIRELLSLVHSGFSHPAALPNTVGTGQWSEGDPFSNVLANFYWSSTSESQGGAFVMYMGGGSVTLGNKIDTFAVWPVRGGAEGGACSEAPVPRTGQTTSYGPRDDGELQRGVAWPNPRFTDNGDGTVTDNLTGLIWLKNANCFGPRAWSDALADANSLASGSCGLTDGSVAGDWRLPNVRELHSLVYYGQVSPPGIPNTEGTGQWSEGDPFSGVLAHFYWTSNSGPGAAGFVNTIHRAISGTWWSNSLIVWPVRGGQC